MNRRLYLTYLILGTLGIISLTVSHAYADFEVTDTYGGTGAFNQQSTQSWLEWEMRTQTGIEKGRTSSVLGFSQLSFLADGDKLKSVQEISVTGVTEQSGIGSNYCYTIPNFVMSDVIVINGVSYDIGNSQSSVDDINNPLFKGGTIKFIPNVVDRLLLIKHGVIIQDGDIVSWKVSAIQSFRLWEGVHAVGDSKIPDYTTSTPSDFLPNESGEGKCLVKEIKKDFDGTVVDRPKTDLTFFTTGMSTTFHMTWVDIGQQIIDNFTGAVDDDGDGISDENDLCTFTPENYNGYQDADGCPDVIPLTPEQQALVDAVLGKDDIVIINDEGLIEVIPDLDTDNDGFANDVDFCPNEPENFNGIQDFDGCPDGTITQVGNFEDDEGNPIIFDNTDDRPIITVPNQELSDFIAENTNPLEEEIIIIEIDTGIETEQGISDTCNPIFENCNQVIADAVSSIEETTGIKLPFEPSIINFVIIFGVIGIVVFMIGKATKKI